MRMVKHISVLICVCLLAVSCGKKKELAEPEYLKWLDDTENGLSLVKKVNGLEMKIKFLPPDYNAYLELSSLKVKNKKVFDSLCNDYSNNMTFLFSIGPSETEENGTDIMFRSIQSYQEYTERVVAMNFEMEQYVTLNINNKEYKPVLSSMENSYGLENKRNMLFVFVPADKNDTGFKTSEKMDFVYLGELFDTGINHFVFTRTSINEAPEIKVN